MDVITFAKFFISTGLAALLNGARNVCHIMLRKFVFTLLVGLLSVSWSSKVRPRAVFNLTEKQTFLVFGDNSNQDQYSESSIWESFRNKRIAFLGDSTLRYQYQDLAYFLVNRQWPKPADKLCDHSRFKTWVKFIEYEHKQMKGHEQGETYRNEEMCCGGWTVCDNRQLHVPKLNATVWYFLWFGNQSSPHGHFNIAKGLKKAPCKPGHCSITASKHPWMLQPAEFARQFITAHKPDLFFFNCGLHGYPFDAQYPWGVDQGRQFKIMLEKLKSLSNIRTKVIWKATTPHTDALITINESVAEDLAREGLVEMYNPNSVILDLAQIHQANRKIHDYYHPHYPFNWDAAHYNCWVYSEMNRELAVKFLYTSV